MTTLILPREKNLKNVREIGMLVFSLKTLRKSITQINSLRH